MKTVEVQYNVTKKELEAFVLAGWRLSAEGFDAKRRHFITSGVPVSMDVLVDEVIAELTEETK